jgi:hypothetical protein
VDTIVNTNVKGSKVFGLAFVKVAGVTDVFTQDEVRAFVLPKLSEPTLTGSAIVQLDNVSSGGESANHSGRGDERFTGVLTKVFLNGIVDDTVTTNVADVTGTAGVDVYFLTMDGINETAVRMNKHDPLLGIGASVSASVNGVAGTTYSLVYESSSLSDMVYKQLVPDTGDYIHSSSTFFGTRNVISLIDGVTNNWNNAWHGQPGNPTMYAIYEFAGEEKLVSSMDFYQVPGSNLTGVINIYYWDGSTFVEVSYTNNNQFVNTIQSEKINISFHTVQSNQFKIRVNKHAGNGSTLTGLSEWTLKH